MPEWARIILIIVLSGFIGYITNLIAIKMLFRPYTKKHIGKIPIPFTPGIIPKNRYRLSAGIADMISQDIISSDDLTQNLIKNTNLDGTIIDILTAYSLIDSVTRKKDDLIEKISDEIIDKFENGSLARKIVSELLDGIKPKLGFLGGMVDSFAPLIEQKINEYVSINAFVYIKKFVDEKYDELIQKDVKSFDEIISNLLKPFITTMIEKIDLNKAIKDGIDKLDIKEFEKMLIKLVKKELRAITYLGALLGAVIGVATIFLM